MKNVVVYDIEILNAIPPPKGSTPIEGINYCKGWDDFEGMGIAVICAYEYKSDRYRVFTHGNISEFCDLLTKVDYLIGFNNYRFDDKLLAANHITLPDSCISSDLLAEIWTAQDIDPLARFNPKLHGGYGLDAVALVNLGVGKSGDGASAAIEWQLGGHGRVIDYCLRDVWLTKRLLDTVHKFGFLANPKRPELVKMAEFQAVLKGIL